MGKDSQKYFDQHGFPAEVAQKNVQFLMGNVKLFDQGLPSQMRLSLLAFLAYETTVAVTVTAPLLGHS